MTEGEVALVQSSTQMAYPDANMFPSSFPFPFPFPSASIVLLGPTLTLSSPPQVAGQSTVEFEIELLSVDSPLKFVVSKREEGNRLFQNQKYEEAKKL